MKKTRLLIKRKKISSESEGEDEEYEDEDYEDEDYEIKKKQKIELQSLKKHPVFKQIITDIKNTEQDIQKIVNNNILNVDRVSLFQLYEIYTEITPNTVEWIEIRNKYISLYNESIKRYKKHSQFTEEHHNEMNREIKLLETYSNEDELKYKIVKLNTSKSNKEVIFSHYTNWRSMSIDNEEYNKMHQYLKWCVDIPHDNLKTFSYSTSQLTVLLKTVKTKLDNELYGIEHVKEQLLYFISSKILNPTMKKCSLGLIGIPGVGKTRIAVLLSEILNFPFEQISLGCVTSSILKGHDYTYIGAQPGEIVKCLKRMKYKNGILFFDEYEKISHDYNLCSLLLHITDPTQNSKYRDNYLMDITIDLSNLWFIYSMNELPKDTALKDRIFDIYVPGYELEDKIKIVQQYLLPKSLTNINRKINDVTFVNCKVCKECILKIQPDIGLSGIRQLEKVITSMINKIDFIVNHGNILYSKFSEKLKYPIKLTTEIFTELIII